MTSQREAKLARLWPDANGHYARDRWKRQAYVKPSTPQKSHCIVVWMSLLRVLQIVALFFQPRCLVRMAWGHPPYPWQTRWPR
ncbi:MAG: hypothetical protein HY783_04150 [Chloroflexi bacterium]|nr:hypothetical protein [Chloroflexota bacterium]